MAPAAIKSGSGLGRKPFSAAPACFTEEREDMKDLIIIGGGPAGLTAAIYARRAGKSVLVLEKEGFGGQITLSPKVENIPGFTEITGSEFADKLTEQALFQGAECDVAEVLSVRDQGEVKTVVTDAGELEARAVIIATGATHRRLGLPHEEELIGNGISFCAVCDGAFYEGETVGVIGGGNSALQEAVQLSAVCKEVLIFQDLPFLTGEAMLQEEIKKKDNVKVRTGVRVLSYLGEETLTGIRVEDRESGKEEEVPLAGLFVAVGLVPQNEPFQDLLPLDERGYLSAGEGMESSVPGIFIAGDCRAKKIRQVTTAAADGALAALSACAYLDR